MTQDTIRKSSNTVWHAATVTRQRREQLNGHRSVLIWFTGLSGSGKSTLAHSLEEELYLRNCRTFLFDGDNVRHGLCSRPRGDFYPPLIWGTNGLKLPGATMFTLFFAGNDFAPQVKVDGEPVQEFLQRHYIEAMRQVALRLKDLPNVFGFDTLNEPNNGYIGWKDLTQPVTLARMLDSIPAHLNPCFSVMGFCKNCISGNRLCRKPSHSANGT